MNDHEKKLPFTITKLDGLGQGVSRLDGKVTFIPKTLQGEQGFAEIIEEKKKLRFAKCLEITTPSEHRVVANCSHFEVCGGCHYLHTSYTEELNYKKLYLKELLERRNLSYTSFHSWPAPQRQGYRNRIQLHYDLKKNVIGFHEKKTNSILPLKECLLPSPDIQVVLKPLLDDPAKWFQTNISFAPPKEGTLELYQRPGESVKTHINQHRAQGGFTQVNEVMNQKLIDIIQTTVAKFPCGRIVDLFGGSGNLTKTLSQETLIVDGHIPRTDLPSTHRTLQGDLYAEIFLHTTLLPEIKKSKSKLGVILDPPRSGWSSLATFLSAISPAFCIYVSCNPETLVRDLQTLGDQWQIQHIHLVDMFPSTHHFETVAVLKNDKK